MFSHINLQSVNQCITLQNNASYLIRMYSFTFFSRSKSYGQEWSLPSGSENRQPFGKENFYKYILHIVNVWNPNYSDWPKTGLVRFLVSWPLSEVSELTYLRISQQFCKPTVNVVHLINCCSLLSNKYVCSSKLTEKKKNLRVNLKMQV